MHSPWGALYPLIEKTGWKMHYILWKVSWINIQMILADQPGFSRGKKKETVKVIPITGKEAFNRFFK